MEEPLAVLVVGARVRCDVLHVRWQVAFMAARGPWRSAGLWRGSVVRCVGAHGRFRGAVIRCDGACVALDLLRCSLPWCFHGSCSPWRSPGL